MQAYYSDHFVLPLPEGHRFPMTKYRLLRDRVAAELPGITLMEAPAATDGELALAHTPQYVGEVAEGRLSAAQQREIGFPWSAAMVARSRRSVGASIAAARAALNGGGVAFNLAGGTHHAYADRGSGFCVFNDVVVAARRMQAESTRRGEAPLRVAVIDLDVHQGNGTAAICRDDPSITTLSMHGAKNFPFRKEASDIDVDLPDGCADDEYLAALDSALERLWRHAESDDAPRLIFFLAGADPHEGDRLGRLKLTAAGLAERDRRVFAAALERRIPVAVSMAGGYGTVIEDTVALQLTTLRLAFTHWQTWQSLYPRTPDRRAAAA
ncbi:MAG: histone deacetylase [Burkholderiales bacterium PBB1]|nr:MAG: histone deacetylase [Burkholderiales bacterium PBB1]